MPPRHETPLAGRGRSSVLAALMPRARRKRRLKIRWLATALVLATAVLCFWSVHTEALAPTGAGRLIYLAHDALWVPAWSWVWTAARPWSLIWLLAPVPLAVLALIEFLGLAQPLRFLQTVVLRALLRSPLAEGLVALQSRIGPKDGFLTRLISADLRVFEDAARQAAEAPGQHFPETDAAEMARRARWLMRLCDGSDAVQIRLCEVSALLARHDPPPPDLTVLDALWQDAPWAPLASPTQGDLVQTLARLQAAGMDRAALAAATLGAARLARQDRAPRALDWFARWAELRLGPTAFAAELAAAETLISFEFWAAETEANLLRGTAAAARTGWLGRLLPGVETCRPSGEMAAAGLAAAAPERPQPQTEQGMAHVRAS